MKNYIKIFVVVCSIAVSAFASITFIKVKHGLEHVGTKARNSAVLVQEKVDGVVQEIKSMTVSEKLRAELADIQKDADLCAQQKIKLERQLKKHKVLRGADDSDGEGIDDDILAIEIKLAKMVDLCDTYEELIAAYKELIKKHLLKLDIEKLEFQIIEKEDALRLRNCWSSKIKKDLQRQKEILEGIRYRFVAKVYGVDVERVGQKKIEQLSKTVWVDLTEQMKAIKKHITFLKVGIDGIEYRGLTRDQMQAGLMRKLSQVDLAQNTPKQLAVHGGRNLDGVSSDEGSTTQSSITHSVQDELMKDESENINEGLKISTSLRVYESYQRPLVAESRRNRIKNMKTKV